ncbi:GNAT family N-acetyltransferase [Flectobacillus major]|jgi:ribosomal protein S18 acetylase RimI-like enzyme|uniref:GNAT family N-acetyltransferase n=1 Tax=Flectobacillus major TaxID=103 RepID=UPI0004207BB5|nr:GNAT family N-acetyltransferase [Flectobacillus major]
MQLRYIQYSPEELQEVKDIFLEYAQNLNVDLCFQRFEQELETLSKIYAPPQGCIILAYHGQEVAGCIALKPIAEGVCEMKRLYVKNAFRGHSLGRKLAQEAISFAKQNGYQTMKLDTLTTLHEAIGLYKSLGFQETPPYTFNPLDNVLYFELNLAL